ncbi:MAG TPA: amino acid adenylation domain-containing protein [Vicinamibacterales bacterium]|nr:amino acid adenylation domain-containing protein [Vicinamibacterales bacterium]
MIAFTSATCLGDVLEEAFRRFSGQPALWVKGQTYTYSALEQLARGILSGLPATDIRTGRVAILAERNEIAYAGILGTVLAGLTYVPLNPRFSAARILDILQQVDADVVISDNRGAAILESIRESLPPRLAVLVAEGANPASNTRPRSTNVRPDDTVYILFTSGTTGRPKGVPVSQANVMAFLANICNRVPSGPGDRFLQLLDLSFDPSVHDLFGCWSTGGTLYSAPEGMATMADRFVRDFQITHLSAVASTAALLHTQNRLAPRSLPSVRETIFGGEALPVNIASAWRTAAPNATVRNHYGPTEATVAITECVWRDAWAPELSGSVPIGRAFDGQTIALVDDGLRAVPPGTPGELLVSGSQVTRGYLNNPDMTREKFIALPGAQGCWYRTGDLVVDDPLYGLRYRGRADQQLKVRGFRVEGQEVESHVRAASGTDLVAVVGWPKNEEGLVMGLVAFVVGPKVTPDKIIESCRTRMPDYMVPARVITVPELPLNANGKIDHAALARSLDSPNS